MVSSIAAELSGAVRYGLARGARHVGDDLHEVEELGRKAEVVAGAQHACCVGKGRSARELAGGLSVGLDGDGRATT